MQLSLLVIRGVHEGKEILVPQPHFSIGRDETCDLRAQSMAVSRRHAAILVSAGKVVICDLGSRNGTYVNEIPVPGHREIRHNDRLRIGPLEFRVQVRQPLSTPDRQAAAAEDLPSLPHDSHSRAAPAVTGSSPDENHARSRPSFGGSGASSSSVSSVGVPEWIFPTTGAALLKQYLGRPHL
jgi:pSer/pThr/pTyr-binding forkhead associated (FHA) protein